MRGRLTRLDSRLGRDRRKARPEACSYPHKQKRNRAIAQCHVRTYRYSAGIQGGVEWIVVGLVERTGARLVTRMTLRTLYQVSDSSLLELMPETDGA